MESDVLFLTVADRRQIRATLRHQVRVMCDATKQLEAACDVGDHYGVIVAFERASHKWADAIGVLATIVELVGSGPKDWIRDTYNSIDDIFDNESATTVKNIASVAVPLLNRVPKIFIALLRYKELFTLNHHVGEARKDVLMKRVLHYRSTWKISEHNYEEDEIPNYGVSALMDSDGNTFYGSDKIPDSPVEALGACNARLHRLYEKLLKHVEEVAPHATLLRAFNDRLNMNDRIITQLMMKGTNDDNVTRRIAG